MSVIFVTGVSRGIGHHIAKLFIERGHNVYGCARTAISIDGARKIFRCDVKSLAALKECSKYIMKAEGKCDVLINNAGIIRDKTLQKMIREQWEDVINTNFMGVHYSTLAFLHLLQESDNGCIINISSVVALHGAFGQTIYGASKAAIIGYSRSCALELAKHSIRVNTVVPGYIDTKMTKTIPEHIRQDIISRIALRRFGTPMEVAELVNFLSSDKASYITGGVYEISGGLQ